ncbi:DUF6912 family protein [Nocardioides alcanivorans]|uniref:DUF6912 family protein n=1 Tax=Nocardioides alcanivorans TaxID=2897352 RepID=UPI001F2F51AE|nr:hypothetical protein [Nocardioides alcanivorans]
MSHRIYLPLTGAELADLVTERRLEGPRAAYAVTDALRSAVPDGDDDDLEYVAMAAAADASWQSRRDGDRPRRVVVAADVSAIDAVSGEHPAEVVVAHGVVWRNVASAHVDTADVTAAEAESDDAPDLAWFATQELATLV